MDNSDRTVEKLFMKMEQKKDFLIDLIRSMPYDKYIQQPKPGHWSAGQAANHLYLSEKLSFAYLRKKMAYPDTIPPFHIKSWMGMIKLKIIMLRLIKARAPKTINMWEDQEVLHPNDLDRKWKDLRIELFDFVREKYPLFGSHLVYNHPVAGRLSMKQMITFFIDHIEHHTRQVKRILKEINAQK